MTPKQASKHKEAIKWFCDNPDKMVWKKDHKTNTWYLCEQPAFDYKDIYVQDDEYSEYRRALADGKTIQFYYEIHNVEPKIEGEWRDWNSYGQCFENAIKYRIKPEEPEFKVGDWVYCTIKQGTTTLRQFKEEMNEWVNIYKLTKWVPVENEWCVFWNNKDTDYTLRKARNANLTQDEYCIEWDNIAPLEFTKTLKTLKG